MTYRSRIAAVISFTAVAVFMAAGLSVWSVKSTDRHIYQANLAQNLLAEHLQVSVHTYRLFKQLTDEILLGSSANQSVVRRKRQAISKSLTEIRRLELEQRQALGADFVPGAVEDTAELEHLIDSIIREFQAAVSMPPGLERSERVDAILEEQIDVGFRDRVNAALGRQRTVVSQMNNRIQYVHSRSVGVSIGLALATLLIGLAMGWVLIKGIASPLSTLKIAAETWGRGAFNHRIAASSDAEFDQITSNFNAMAERLGDFAQQRERTERELQDAVAERTDELFNANQALQQADAVRRQFFADVSHELRTPLTLIRGEAQVTLRGKERSGDDYREALTTVLDQAVSLSRLVDDMLFIARTDAERIRLMREPLNLEKLIGGVVRETGKLAEAREVAIETDLSAEMVEVVADPDRIRQLLLILIDNAIRFSPAGSAVTVQTRADGASVALSVSDKGPGIDSQDLPHIFDRFFRGGSEHGDSNRSQAASGGLGLGLAVAKAIVLAHGGDISGESVPGRGTTITAKVPHTV